MAVHVMLDLETWGNSPEAMPVSIGAVKFDATSILDRFHIGIDPRTVPGDRRVLAEADTLMWWMDPERDEARKVWWALEKTDIATALEGFFLWYKESKVGWTADPAIWGNGSTFDNVILRNAYKAMGMDYPAPFWKDWCYRTVKNLRPDIKLERIGTHHSAVDDAESQARHLQAIALALGVEL